MAGDGEAEHLLSLGIDQSRRVLWERRPYGAASYRNHTHTFGFVLVARGG